MDCRARIKLNIEEHLKKSVKEIKFAIYPFGIQGQLAKQILSVEYGIEDVLIIDNYLCRYNKNIISLSELSNINCSKYVFLLVSSKEEIYAELRIGLAKYVKKEKIIDVFSIRPYVNIDDYFSPPYYSNPRYSAWELCAKEIYMNNIQGAVAEAGVHQGYSARILNRLFCNRKLYLFDTFKGFDNRDIEYDIEQGYKLSSYCSNDYTKNHLLADTNEQIVMSSMAYPENIVIKKGWFPDTTTDLEEEFCFVSLDMDLYKPIYAGLGYFYPRLTVGGYIFIHDYKRDDADWTGCGEAVRDYCHEMKIGYTPICDSEKYVSAVIAK